MVDLFTSQPGYVAAINTSYAAPMHLQIEGWAGAATLSAIITGISLRSEASAQFQHALDRFISVYVFGDRVGDMVLQGLAFPGYCGQTQSLLHGMEHVHAYYRLATISNVGLPIQVVLGTQLAFACYLLGISHQTIDADACLDRFALRLAVMP